MEEGGVVRKLLWAIVIVFSALGCWKAFFAGESVRTSTVLCSAERAEFGLCK